MFTKSIRWRFLLWLAFLLICILSGFGLTAYQLHRTNLINQIDEDLQHRVAAVSGDVRGRPPFGERGGRRPFGERGGRPPVGGRGERLPFDGLGEGRPFGDGPGKPPLGPPPRDSQMPRGFLPFGPGPREIRLSGQTLGLFDETATNGFYYAVWSREGSLLKQSTNAWAEVTRPERVGADTQPHTQRRGPFREVFHFTEMGECVLVGRSIVGDLQGHREGTRWQHRSRESARCRRDLHRAAAGVAQGCTLQ